MRIEVYWNLHKKLYSVRALEGPNKGRVIDHSNCVSLRDVSFVVQPAGREKVRREKRKTVHAFVRGTRIYESREMPNCKLGATQVTYNPYHNDTFMERGTCNPIYHADVVVMGMWKTGGPPVVCAYKYRAQPTTAEAFVTMCQCKREEPTTSDAIKAGTHTG